MTQEGVHAMKLLYSITSDHAHADGQRKLGCTIHPVHRMRTLTTGDAPGIGVDKRYEALWEIGQATRLFTSEKLLHSRFHSARQTRAGNFTEWFRIPFEDVCTFLGSQEFVIRMLSVEEVETINKQSQQSAPKTRTPEEKALCDADDELMREQQSELVAPAPQSLKSEFFATFLPQDCEPRRIQTELWDIVESRLALNDENGKQIVGLVQWATGVGKTLGLLMLIVLAADHWKRTGRIYRGLLVAPTNDIFETLMVHFRKLTRWGITVCEGFNSRMSSLHIPHDCPVLVLGTHASFTDTAVGTDCHP